MDEKSFHFLLQNKENYTRFLSVHVSKWVSQVLPGHTPAFSLGHISRDVLLDQALMSSLSDLDASLLILGWGGMRRGHARALFKRSEWLSLVAAIRRGEITHRQEAYRQFYELSMKGEIPGMGPAYYTKLICFLNPSLKGYIMDQWTGKSVNMLMGSAAGKTVALDVRTGLVLRTNQDSTYEWFCQSIEEIGRRLGCNYLQAEEYIFSSGGRKKGSWRQLVYDWHRDQTSRLPGKRELVKPMDFTEIMAISLINPMRCNTLEGDQFFTYQRKQRFLQLTLSTGESASVGKQDWNTVMDRFNSLSDQCWDSACYLPGSKPYNWNDSPLGSHAPCLPALVRQWKNVDTSDTNDQEYNKNKK